MTEQMPINPAITPKMQTLINLCKVVYQRSLDKGIEGEVDFDDMVYLTLQLRAKFQPKDFVLVDEAQDLNPARRILAIRMAGQNGRVIAVGDRNQAIYGFTGADSDSMDIVKNQLGAVEFPLNQTFRCPSTRRSAAPRLSLRSLSSGFRPTKRVRTILRVWSVTSTSSTKRTKTAFGKRTSPMRLPPLRTPSSAATPSPWLASPSL